MHFEVTGTSGTAHKLLDTRVAKSANHQSAPKAERTKSKLGHSDAEWLRVLQKTKRWRRILHTDTNSGSVSIPFITSPFLRDFLTPGTSRHLKSGFITPTARVNLDRKPLKGGEGKSRERHGLQEQSQEKWNTEIQVVHKLGLFFYKKTKKTKMTNTEQWTKPFEKQYCTDPFTLTLSPSFTLTIKGKFEVFRFGKVLFGKASHTCNIGATHI